MGIYPVEAHGHAAGFNGQELGIGNELKMLECLGDNGWLRERELHLLTGMSMYMVGQVSRRLAKKYQICRKREAGNAGYFLRLLPAGSERLGVKIDKDIAIPICWAHHAMAIQSLYYLARLLKCRFETESCMRRNGKSGKYPDGRLVADNFNFFFEQEWSRKSGPSLRKQTEVIARLASEGTICILAYPYPAENCGGIDHETRLTNSIRHKWGSPAAPNIVLLRCHFNSLIAYQNVQVGAFEAINLPKMKLTAASRKSQPGVTDQIKGFKWITKNRRQSVHSTQINYDLVYDGNVEFECTFIEGESGDDYHRLESSGKIMAEDNADLVDFYDFIRYEQKKVEKQLEPQILNRQLRNALAEPNTSSSNPD